MLARIGRRGCMLLPKRLITTSIDPIQEKYFAEQCIEVNRIDEPIGRVTKKECHINPILHRAFSVFIFDPDKRLLLQKRSPTKVTFPEVWTNACCSHPHYTEMEMIGELGIKNAAKRKLQHELGITASTNEMHVMGRFIYKANSDAVWVEHEMDYAICMSNFDAPIKPNPEEVAEIRFVTQSELENMFADKKLKFSPWFTLFSSFNWLDLWWNNLEKLESHKDPVNIHNLN